MKRSIIVLIIVMVAFAGSAPAQAPERGQGGGRGGGRGRGPAAPQLTGPVADTVNMIVAALNNQDAAYLQRKSLLMPSGSMKMVMRCRQVSGSTG